MNGQRSRLRDLGVSIGTLPTGKFNAITDVAGVTVGHRTVWSEGPGKSSDTGIARTGVTAIWPDSSRLLEHPVAAGFFALSATGEMTARSEIEELGHINTPFVLTNTMSVGIAYDAVCRYLINQYSTVGREAGVQIPLIAECDDSYLNDARGMHVTREHVYDALDFAAGGPVAEGCVGAGTGMHSFQFKGGIGTSSRRISETDGGWTIGVLVLTNFGLRHRLTFAGAPIGEHFPLNGAPVVDRGDEGSGIVVIATDAPLDGRQLSRVARRASLGLGRTGSIGGNGSGELLVAFSTSYRPATPDITLQAELVEGNAIDAIFGAAIDATEEAVLNALCMATTTHGLHGHVRDELPLDQTVELLKQYGRMG